MHIEAGVVEGTKMLLSYATASAVGGVTLKLAVESVKESGIVSLLLKTIIATMVVFFCFEVLPHQAVGVSEVHLILGTTIFFVLGVAPALMGLAFGLLIQGLFFAQFDLPQYGINVTTLLASMIALNYAAKKIIPAKTAYKDISYTQMFKMSALWQGSIVTWVAFWALYGQGFSVENIMSVSSFGVAYMGVVLIEPLVDLAILSAVKASSTQCNIFFDKKLLNCEKV